MTNILQNYNVQDANNAFYEHKIVRKVVNSYL